MDAWPIVLYPFLYVLPFTGSIAILCGVTVRPCAQLLLADCTHCMTAPCCLLAMAPLMTQHAMTCSSGMQGVVYRAQDLTLDTRYGIIPNLPVPFSHPQTAGGHLLPLDPAINYTATVRLSACP